MLTEDAPLIYDNPPRYHAFVLRCWEVRSPTADAPVAWRFSLEVPDTRERFGFGDMEALVAFLNDTLAGTPEVPEEPSL